MVLSEVMEVEGYHLYWGGCLSFTSIDEAGWAALPAASVTPPRAGS